MLAEIETAACTDPGSTSVLSLPLTLPTVVHLPGSLARPDSHSNSVGKPFLTVSMQNASPSLFYCMQISTRPH